MSENEPTRLSQLRNFVRSAMNAELDPAESIEEIRFRLTLETLAPKLQEVVIEHAIHLFNIEAAADREPIHLDSDQYPKHFYELGNILLAYLGYNRDRFIDLFETEGLPLPQNPTEVATRAWHRADSLLNRKQVVEVIARHDIGSGVIDDYCVGLNGFQSFRDEVVQDLERKYGEGGDRPTLVRVEPSEPVFL